MRDNPNKKPNAKEMFCYLTGEARSLLIRQGESQTEAQKHATAFTMRVLEKIGGCQYYILKKTRTATAERLSHIKSDFKISGGSVKDLALRHKISAPWAYLIIKSADEIDLQKNREYCEVENTISIEAARMLVLTGTPIVDAAPMAKGFASVMLTKFAGQQLFFPSSATILKQKQADDIWKQYQAGHAIPDIALRYGLSGQAIYLSIRERCKQKGLATPAEQAKHEKESKHEELWRLYQEGITVDAIAKQYGFSYQYVLNVIRKRCNDCGQRLPPEKMKDHPLKQVRRRVLQIAEDYRIGNQQAFDQLQGLAEQIDSVRKSLI